jgi:hypothetical protein
MPHTVATMVLRFLHSIMDKQQEEDRTMRGKRHWQQSQINNTASTGLWRHQDYSKQLTIGLFWLAEPML